MKERFLIIAFPCAYPEALVIKQVELSEFLFIKHYLRERWAGFVIHPDKKCLYLKIYYCELDAILNELYNRPHHIGAGRSLSYYKGTH